MPACWIVKQISSGNSRIQNVPFAFLMKRREGVGRRRRQGESERQRDRETEVAASQEPFPTRMVTICKFLIKGSPRISDSFNPRLLFIFTKRGLLFQRTATLPALTGKNLTWPSISQFNTLVSRDLPKYNGLQLWNHHHELPAGLRRDFWSLQALSERK